MIKSITKVENDKTEPVDAGNAVTNRLKMFQQSAKKQSIVVSSSNTKNNHMSLINSCNVLKDSLITSDCSGFVKVWKF